VAETDSDKTIWHCRFASHHAHSAEPGFQLLSIMTVAVLILPTHYIAKSIYLSWGVIYWHVVPVIAALSPADRTRQVSVASHPVCGFIEIFRVPALFGDAPTDAEYAMDLIGERVASGQDITLRGKKVNQRQQMANVSNSNVDESRPEEKGGVDWKKWGARIAQGKSLLEDNKPISSISRVSCLTRPTYIVRSVDS